MTDEQAWQWLINGLNWIVKMLAAQKLGPMTAGQRLSIQSDIKKLEALLHEGRRDEQADRHPGAGG